MKNSYIFDQDVGNLVITNTETEEDLVLMLEPEEVTMFERLMNVKVERLPSIFKDD